MKIVIYGYVRVSTQDQSVDSQKNTISRYCMDQKLGVIQASMYDKGKEKILHLYHLGVSIKKIISTHLGHGKYLSLKAFINKF